LTPSCRYTPTSQAFTIATVNDTRIRLPGTDIETSRLGFGTAALHRKFGSRPRQALLGAALECGITYFDSARYYGHGLAETELGRFIRNRRAAVTIGTKIGISALPTLEAFPPLLYLAKSVGMFARPIYRGDPFLRRIDMSVASSIKQAEESVAASLRALATDYLDLLLLHDPSPIAELADEWIAWLSGLKRKGIVRALGLAGQADACTRIARQHPSVAEVLQVGDSLEGREADQVLALGRPLQITFGYLRTSLQRRSESADSTELRAVARRIMERNPTGTVLFSSTNLAHVKQFALSAFA
jgi:aryl-alcohol dehydrogenase-like predicted oxidoreductase